MKLRAHSRPGRPCEAADVQARPSPCPIDPQGARAEIEQIDAGLKSCTQARAERGYKAKQVDTEIAADKAPREITRAEFRVVFG